MEERRTIALETIASEASYLGKNKGLGYNVLTDTGFSLGNSISTPVITIAVKLTNFMAYNQ